MRTLLLKAITLQALKGIGILGGVFFMTWPTYAKLPSTSYRSDRADSELAETVINRFAKHGYRLSVDRSRINPHWPVRGNSTRLLTRYGTPVQNIGGYFHSALDILKENSDSTDDVLSPFTGKAIIFAGRGPWQRWGSQAYETSIAIWDSESHAIALLVHVKPENNLIPVGLTSVEDGTFIDVTKGQKIATIATDLGQGLPRNVEREKSDFFWHVHFSIFDGEFLESLNPIKYVGYRDSVRPTIINAYLLNEDGQRKNYLESGRHDIVIEAYDRDDDSNRNFEIGSIAYDVFDQNNRLLASSKRCHLDSILRSLKSGTSNIGRKVIHFGAVSRATPENILSNNGGNRNIVYPYVLTHFRAESSSCDFLDDETGYIQVFDTTSQITIELFIWDHSGNRTFGSLILNRDP